MSNAEQDVSPEDTVVLPIVRGKTQLAIAAEVIGLVGPRNRESDALAGAFEVAVDSEAPPDFAEYAALRAVA